MIASIIFIVIKKLVGGGGKMYKVLLVDDERIILEGIAKVVDWEKVGTRLIDTAKNGIEAYEKITSYQPDIVITDIKMPGMDGLSLVAKTIKKYPAIQFIILSGYSEFEYAKKAIDYGVKRYLLKPCNENMIIEALESIIKEKKKEEVQNHISESYKILETQVKSSKKYIKEQLLKDFFLNKTYSHKDLNFFERKFNIDLKNEPVQLILCYIEGISKDYQFYALTNMGTDIFKTLLLNTVIEDYTIFLVKKEDEETLQNQLYELKEAFKKICKAELTIVVSKVDFIKNVRELYLQAIKIFSYRFYLGIGKIIYNQHLFLEENKININLSFDTDKFIKLIKSGNRQQVQEFIAGIFQELKNKKLNINTTKTMITKFLLSVVQSLSPKNSNEYLDQITKIVENETIEKVQLFFEKFILTFVEKYEVRNLSKQAELVRKINEILNEQFSNPDFTLKMLANKMMYMNADYLGKIFKKETGKNFSTYLTILRIKKAKEIIEEQDNVKISNLANMVGFGNNPQYFSQVFKKYTGYTPSEYKDKLQKNVFPV